MTYRLRVNPITCDANGVCAELLPEFIRLDPWGYPIVPGTDLPDELIEHARLAAAACPTLALLVKKAPRRHG
ncbi:MAG TPA: ferredoxin [Streptosporangiaceae bacterium]|jgi:ferredoxin|nr:ferredoxin [Streptosporangiaceae bacterium]